MAKIGKLEAAKRQLDAAIRMFFRNEDMLAIHTVSRAAFRVLYDITEETNAKKALDTHIKKVGPKRFHEETNFLKHADEDPAAEIDENFQDFTEAGIGMAIGLYKSHDSTLSPEMASFLAWSALMRPGFYDLSDEANKMVDDWRKASSIHTAKEQEGARLLGDLILHWSKKNWATLVANLDKKAGA